ncbi:MAG: hypothetical protein ABFR31_04630 [Thermodesulfobacteriota bacterium]
MGSLGSGRRYKSDEVKKVVENQISINILDLKKRDCLKPGNISSTTYSVNGRKIGLIFISAAEDILSLDYRFNGHIQQQTVQITSISPHYGGQRQYLLCPQCDSRRNSLYHGPNGQFECRICHGFVFRSQQLNPHLRHAHRAEKFAERLGGTGFIFHGKKPPGMWDTTFIELRDKYFTHTINSCDLFIEYSDNILKKYGSEMEKEDGL